MRLDELAELLKAHCPYDRGKGRYNCHCGERFTGGPTGWALHVAHLLRDTRWTWEELVAVNAKSGIDVADDQELREALQRAGKIRCD